MTGIKNILYKVKFLNLFFIISLPCLCAYGQQNENTKQFVNPQAKILNDSAISVMFHSQDYNKALILLDKAIEIDSNYITALNNKVSFEMELKQFDKALITLKRIIAIKPQIPEYHFFAGLIYVISGDTTSSQNYFKEADNCYNTILDSISKENKSYDFVLMNKAVNLICMGDEEKGNNILKQLYANEKDDIEKEVLSDFINKSRSEIVNYFLNGKQDTTTMLAGKPSKPKRIRFLKLKDNKRHKLSSGLYLLKRDYVESEGFRLRDTDEYYDIAKKIKMSFKNIDSVYKGFDKYSKEFVLFFSFNKIGSKKLSDFTKKCINQKVGIFINNKLITASQVYYSIDNGKMELSGKFTENEIGNMELLVKNAIIKRK